MVAKPWRPMRDWAPNNVCHQPRSFDWRRRGGAPHPMTRIPDARFAEVLTVRNQIVQLARA